MIKGIPLTDFFRQGPAGKFPVRYCPGLLKPGGLAGSSQAAVQPWTSERGRIWPGAGSLRTPDVHLPTGFMSEFWSLTGRLAALSFLGSCCMNPASPYTVFPADPVKKITHFIIIYIKRSKCFPHVSDTLCPHHHYRNCRNPCCRMHPACS